jgi:hypothetical protein
MSLNKKALKNVLLFWSLFALFTGYVSSVAELGYIYGPLVLLFGLFIPGFFILSFAMYHSMAEADEKNESN